MKVNSKSAISYIMRNFWKLVYVALPVAVAMAFFANPDKEVDFWRALIDGRLDFGNLYREFTNAFTVLRFGKLWWVNVIVFALLALTVAMLAVKLNRHMRIGVMPALPFRRAFGLFPVVFLTLLCYFCVSEIAMLLPVGIMYVLRATDNVILVSSLGLAIAFVVRLLTSWVFMLLILALPLKYSENYPLNVGMAYSVRVMTKQPRVVWSITLAYALGRYVINLCAFYARPVYVNIVIYALCYLFAIMYLPAFAYKVYHDVVGGERRDLTQSIFD